MSLLPQGFTSNVGTFAQSVDIVGEYPVSVSAGAGGVAISSAIGALGGFAIQALTADFSTSLAAQGGTPYTASQQIFSIAYTPLTSTSSMLIQLNISYQSQNSTPTGSGVTVCIYDTNVNKAKSLRAVSDRPFFGQGSLISSFQETFLYNGSRATLPSIVNIYVCVFSSTGNALKIISNTSSYFGQLSGSYIIINSVT